MTEGHFEKSYDNDGMADLNERDPYEPDPDDEYEKYRDDCGDQLHEAIKKFVDDFANKKNNYYSNNKSKIMDHLISILQSELQDLYKKKEN